MGTVFTQTGTVLPGTGPEALNPQDPVQLTQAVAEVSGIPVEEQKLLGQHQSSN